MLTLALLLVPDANAFTPDTLWWTTQAGQVYSATITRDGTGAPTGLSNQTLFTTLSSSAHPGLAFHDGLLYVVDATPGTILRYDASGAASATTWASGLPVGFLGMLGLVLAPDGTAYVADYSGGLIEIDPTGGPGPHTRRISGADGLSGAAYPVIDPVLGNVWVASSLNGRLFRYDPSDDSVAFVTTTVAADGALANTCTERSLLVGSHFGGTVAQVAMADGAATALLPTQGSNLEGMTRDDRGWIYTSIGNNSVLRFRADGSQPLVIASTGTDVDDLTWYGSDVGTSADIACGDVYDTDRDGRADLTDNCPAVANAAQGDADADGLGDACDPCADVDGDGYGVGTCVGTDCLDTNAAAHPGGTEVVGDGVDQDCSGLDSVACFTDGDGDDFGGATTVGEGSCDGTGLSAVGGDCLDTNAAANPNGTEVVGDGVDQDCSGADSVDCFADGDGDGFGDAPAIGEGDCEAAGQSDVDGDCDDGDVAVHEGAVEVCNGVDDDCDPLTGTDEGDSDGDGTADCAEVADTDPPDTDTDLLDTDTADTDTADTEDTGGLDDTETFARGGMCSCATPTSAAWGGAAWLALAVASVRRRRAP